MSLLFLFLFINISFHLHAALSLTIRIPYIRNGSTVPLPRQPLQPLQPLQVAPSSSSSFQTRTLLYNQVSSNDNKDDIARTRIPSSSLTIILPAFNEELRIGETIQTYCSYLMTRSCEYEREYECECECECDHQRNWRNWSDWKYRILVVDDGSTDQTCQVVEGLKSFGIQKNQSNKNNSISDNDNDQQNRYHEVGISYVSLPRNLGKGSAISRGIEQVQLEYTLQQQHATHMEEGSMILIADADGSGDIESLEIMIDELWKLTSTPNSSSSSSIVSWNTPAIIVGNRGYNGTKSISRIITRWGFRTAVKLICGDLRINDTQCGFKLMTLKAATILYSNLHLCQWTNDVEVLYRAKVRDIPISEVMVGWEDKDGSKLSSSVWGTIRVSFIMLLEILYMRIQYFVGRWTMDEMR